MAFALFVDALPGVPIGIGAITTQLDKRVQVQSNKKARVIKRSIKEA